MPAASRRDFLRHGLLTLGGLTLPNVLRLRAEAPPSTRPRSVIMICLAGGPSHLDTYDMKPAAPEEYRGEFRPIRTNVPGFDICEHMPLQARIADKLALVRTVQFVEPMQHELEEVYSGFPRFQQRPSFGSVISRVQGGVANMPSYVSLDYNTGTASYESPQYLGAAHRPLQVSGTAGVHNLSLLRGMTPTRLDDRRSLLRNFDTYRREVDVRRESTDMDAYTARAFDIVTSPRAREAFDLSREPEHIRRRYGAPDDRYIYVGVRPESPWEGHKFLLARRLVEAGVPVVTLRAGSWDHHGNVVSSFGGTIFISLRSALPLLDRSIHALVTDLHERGLDRDVLVLIWGEFGRTPRIVQAGRDHWPDTGFALFAGAVRTGQVVGETDSRGERPRTRGVGPQNVLGTVYHTLGIDPTQSFPDFTGRPRQVLDDGQPIRELLL
ncbi:MAG: DUF1501 domain-containing protein [Gemmataceae bacterium]